MTRNKQLIINMGASFTAYLVSLVINFFLSPYIVKKIGVEAYGFVGLANSFIGYAGLITIALNSMAGRFITVSIYKEDMDSANKYFSSVLISNFIISITLCLAFAIVLLNLENLINIPRNIVQDVTILFATLFINCIISTIGSVFSVATFATNKLYLNSMRNIESNVLRLIALCVLFIFTSPRVSYLGTTALLVGIYVTMYNIYYTKKLLPEIEISYKLFDIKSVISIISAGVWNLINRMGQLLLDGLDLLITNIFINPFYMGVLSLAKMVPNLINTLIGNIAGVFSPEFTILYAQEKHDELVQSAKLAMKIMGIITNLPVIILIVCGKEFFTLWQPTQDATMLQRLSILTCGCVVFSGTINCLYNVFTVVNKMKLNSIVVVFSGFLNTIMVYAALKLTNWGIYAVAGISTVLSILRNLLFTVPYAAMCLKRKWYAFYPEVLRSVIFVLISSALSIVAKISINFDGWIMLIVSAVLSGLIALFIGLFVILNKEERDFLKNRLLRRN